MREAECQIALQARPVASKTSPVTTMNPLGAFITLSICLFTVVAPRRWAAAAVVAGTCYLTQGQEINIGFHFTAIRLIILAGMMRVVVRGEFQQRNPSPVDRAVIVYALCLAAITTIRVGTIDELVYQIGGLYNVFLSYFVFRSLLKDKDDITGVLINLLPIIIPLALLMTLEAARGRNLFAIFGAVGEYSLFRDDHFRAQGPFRSPITAGAFGANLALLYGGMFFQGVYRRIAIFGSVVAMMILMCARSSGPLLGFLLGFLALVCWRFRDHTRKIRWGILISLVSLHLVMKAPVWFLLGRLSDVVGGGGYHRAYLIDNFVKRFSTWWLAGTSDTSQWMATELAFGGADLTNQFVSDGVNAGLLCVFFSVMVLVRCFQSIGAELQARETGLPRDAKLLWSLGSALVGNIGILFSVTYFDQMHVIWYFLLAAIGSTAAAVSSERNDDKLHDDALPAMPGRSRVSHQSG